MSIAPIVERRIAVAVGLATVIAGMAAVTLPIVAVADSSGNEVHLAVTGHSLGNLTSSPLSLTPAFDPTITDYVLRCQTGQNPIQLTLAAVPGGTISVSGIRGPSATIKQTLLENQALVLSANRTRGSGWGDVGHSDSIQYWIRCLPHDFPQLNVNKTGNPPPGWYLTGDLTSSAGGGGYAMVSDTNGTPVWYRQSSGASAENVTLLADGTIAWGTSIGLGFAIDPNGAFEDFSLTSHRTRWLAAPSPPTDFHELQTLANGDLMMLATPLRPKVDVSAFSGDPMASIVDCLVEEVDKRGHVMWQWRASDHISAAESIHSGRVTVRRQLAYDLFHCNSVDVDPVSGNVLVSARHTDAIYLVSRATGSVIWKLGGNSYAPAGAELITVRGDQEGTFHAQHDARFQPNGDISLYDNQTWDPTHAARGVEYHVDPASGDATLVWAFTAPDGHNSSATGTFRRLNGGTDNVIGWGAKPNTLFTEVDATGRVLLNVTFPVGHAAYRIVKVPLTALDHQQLRSAAGLPRFNAQSSPAVNFVVPGSGPASGGESVSITGTGFIGATAVYFGSHVAPSFKVAGANLITAIAPPGCGIVAVRVIAPSGSSASVPVNQLIAAASDSSFESGTGSWSGSSTSSLSLSSSFARSGTYSLEIVASALGVASAGTGPYSVQGRAQVAGSVWVLTPSSADQVRASLTFYDSRGTTLLSEAGAVVASSTSRWVQATTRAVAPGAAASMVLNVANESGFGPTFVDDASIAGIPLYTYPPNGPGCRSTDD